MSATVSAFGHRGTTSSVKTEIVRELVNASDGAGLHFEDTGRVSWTNTSATNLGTSDFSIEFVLNQTAENTSDNYIWFTNASGNNRAYLYNDISDNVLRLVFINSSGSASGTNLQLAYDMSADYNTPTHYTVTVDRSGDATLYKNGNSVASVSVSAASAIDLGDGNSNVGQIGSSATGYSFLGTMYRFRTWNKALTSAEVQTAYERADVDSADQYGSQTEKIGDAANRTFASGVGNWGAVGITAANDSGALKIPQTAAFGGGTNNLASFAQRSYLGKDYFNTGGATENNKRYRLSFDAKAVTGGSKLYFNFQNNDDTTNTALNESVTLTTSFASYSVVLEGDFGSAPKFLLAGLDAAESFWLDNVSIVAVGCVSDYELSANPTQSLTVQDRAGSADGTCSASGVTQVQPVVQGNLTSLAVSSGTAVTPADGQVVIGPGTGGDDPKLIVGGEGNAQLRTRHIDGKGSTTSGLDKLFINDNSTGDIVIGRGGGNVGINTSSVEAGWSTSCAPIFEISGTKPTLILEEPSVGEFSFVTKNGNLYISDEENNAARLTIDSTGQSTFTGEINSNSTAPIISMTDSNSFADANDKFIIRGGGGGNEGAGYLQWYDDSASGTHDIAKFDGETQLATFYGGITVNDGFTNIGGSFTEVTIASGAITVTKSLHFVDTEGDAATDDLDTINGGETGALLVLRSFNDSRDVTVKDATGNIYLAGDFTLSYGQRKLTLMKYGGGWYELSRSANA